MNTDTQDLLKKFVREHFGSCEMRFYDNSVTVTLIRDFGKFTQATDLCDEVALLLADKYIENDFGIETVSPNRFKLHRAFDDTQHNPLDLEDNADGLANEMVEAIRNTVDAAHEQSMLEQLQQKEIEREVEAYIMANLGAALVLLEKSRAAISLDETKELMRFAYISGLWANAREKDLQVLSRVFNDKFKAYSNKWNLESNEHGNG